MEAKGFFKADVLKEFLTTFCTFFMYILGFYLVFFTSYAWTGLFSIGFGMFQSGWVSHDYLHHAVLPSVYWNDVIGDIFGILQGYDKGWWKARHNAHHVTTNEVSHDPDIAIAPLLHFVQQYPDLKSTLRHIQKYQHFYCLPVLSLLDIDWRVESIIHVYQNFHKDKLPAVKLVAHYIAVALVMCITGVYPVILLSLLRGLCTSAIVFFESLHRKEVPFYTKSFSCRANCIYHTKYFRRFFYEFHDRKYFVAN